MIKNGLVSIIIPVYNAEICLARCIKSIQNQTYKNIEIILINDGSTDGSGDICEEISNEDNRVKVFNIKNSGPSVARNLGIRVASGEYIQFIDSDDFIEKDMVEKLVEQMKNETDLVICGSYFVNSKLKKTEHIPPIEGLFSKEEFLRNFGALYEKSLINPNWNKFYRLENLKKYKIQFIESISIGEDMLFNLSYIKICKKVKIIQNPLYNYIVSSNANSLTGGFKPDFFKNQELLFSKVKELLITNNCYINENKYKVEYYYVNANIISVLTNLFHKDSTLNYKQKKQEIEQLIKDEWIRNNLKYFTEHTSLFNKLVGKMSSINSIIGIYTMFKIKRIIKIYYGYLFKSPKQIYSRMKVKL
ncbi:glycosyltransferase family 2 protein [Priestia flexa]|uniref:glycosyltransferase family 2 protein n=1 Tax=Priestia flexa TaxID=86664 RepID=UPI000686CB79|nr:glycosyltransferase family 2 protein [Priestia flexa]